MAKLTAKIEHLFVTQLYRAELGRGKERSLVAELDEACRFLAREDVAGRRWCTENKYPGYTSYASLNDLPERAPAFAELDAAVSLHVAEFAKALDLDLGGRQLALDSIWANVLDPGGYHTAHIHPHSVISGTYYVTVPNGAGALKLEDPRLPLMMAAPPRKARASRQNRTFVSVEPKPGTLLLWESWLRHEVPVNASCLKRVSVSFNYGWR
jgi:uncharacterized protein (TIGR02466 family)